MNAFLRELSEACKDDIILLVTDGARWHISKTLTVPSDIKLLRIPPYTPEMNPIEQVWKYIRTQGFKNLAFQTLAAVEDRLCEIVNLITHEVIKIHYWQAMGFGLLFREEVVFFAKLLK